MIRAQLVRAVLVFITIFSCIPSGCSGTEERAFKGAATALKMMLLELKDIRGEVEKGYPSPDSAKDTFAIQLTKKAEFISNQESRWQELSNRFRAVIEKNPEGKWADDAGFCVVMLTLSISLPGNDYYTEAIKEIKAFLNRFSSVHIEDWTKDCFQEAPSFELVLNRELLGPNNALYNLSEEKRIKGAFSRAIVYELLKANKLSEAKQEFKLLRETTESEQVLLGIHNDIQRYEESRSAETGAASANK